MDTPASVIERLLDFYESHQKKDSPLSSEMDVKHSFTNNLGFTNDPSSRASRQRGVTVRVCPSITSRFQPSHIASVQKREVNLGKTLKIEEHTIKASSISDLYSKVLEYLYVNDHFDRLKPLLPFATSRQRYLIAEKPIHPNGKEFVVPVEYKGYHMEAHKDYKNGISHLRKMLDECDLNLIYLG